MNYYLLGFGAVGQSFLRIFQENTEFDPDRFFVVDCDDSKQSVFLGFGGKEDHFYCYRIDHKNCADLINCLKPNDYLFDFAVNIKNTEMLQLCLDRGVHYLSTADSSWYDDKDWKSAFQHFQEYIHIKQNSSSTAATSIIEFGMNPGLVSSFVKAAIEEIINKDNSVFVTDNRSRLRELISNNRFAEAAALLNVTKIIEVDNDDQEVALPFDEHTLYSTWSVEGFLYESIAAPEIAFGTEKEFFKCNKISDFDYDGLFIALDGMSLDYPIIIYSPQGIVTGHLTTHEEIYTIRQFLKYGTYMPTVCFVYSPCDYASRSLWKSRFKQPDSYKIIKKHEVSSGGESVGVILYGDTFSPRYYGNYILTKNTAETATIIQVSASLFAAYKYTTRHSNQGMLFPEELNHHEILNDAKVFLGEYCTEKIDL